MQKSKKSASTLTMSRSGEKAGARSPSTEKAPIDPRDLNRLRILLRYGRDRERQLIRELELLESLESTERKRREKIPW